MKGRTAWVPVTYFNLPKGTQPGDEQNIKKVEATIAALTGAESVTVGLNKTPSGQELIDQYAVDLVMPARIGNYISLDRVDGLLKNANISPDQANALADVIKGLSSGKDVTESLEKLKAPASGDEAGEDGMVKDDPEKGQEMAPPPPRPPAAPGGAGGAGGAAPAAPPRRPPMASINSCARLLSQETGLPMKEAVGHVTRIRRSKDITAAIKWMSSNKPGVGIRKASNLQPYSFDEYETMCRIAWGLPYKKSEQPGYIYQDPADKEWQLDMDTGEYRHMDPEEAADHKSRGLGMYEKTPERSGPRPKDIRDLRSAGRRPLGQRGANPRQAGVQTQELVNELSQNYGLDPSMAPDIIQHVVEKLQQDPEEQRVPMSTSAPAPTAGRRPLV
jgi:hypothetical protein